VKETVKAKRPGRTLGLCMLALSLGAAGCGRATSEQGREQSIRLPEGASLVDLTHPFDATTLYWPTATTGFQHQQDAYGKTPAGYFYSSYSFCAPEHGGTHLDAPIHFAEGHPGADAVPLSRLIAPAVLIDFSADAAKNPDALASAAHIHAFEQAHGAIEPGTIVLFRAGWSARWADKKSYLGDDTPGDASHLHFPGVAEDAAKLLVERKVAAVGIDTASLDYGPSTTFVTHVTLMGADIPGFENVILPQEFPARGALVMALPAKIAGGSGGPLRVVAVLPKRAS
jgi:kynurenine formamidase